MAHFQNLSNPSPSTSQDSVSTTVPTTSKTPLESQTLLKSTSRDPANKTTIPRKLIKKQYVVVNMNEKLLYSKLTALRRQLRKYESKIEKQSASIKMAKRLALNPKILNILENLHSATKILTIMQCREHKKKNKCHPFKLDVKIEALTLFKKSPKAYRFMWKILVLPAPQTLIKLFTQANIQPGINKKIFKELQKLTVKIKGNKKLCILLFDEMSLKVNSDYNDQRDIVADFRMNGIEAKTNLATHAQVFMIRGLIHNYKQPVSYSFSISPTKGHELAKQIKETVIELKKVGFVVVATICDQRVPNRTAINILINETKQNCLRQGCEYRNNLIIINGQEIVPLFDPPHLIKCMRNHLLMKNLQHKINNEIQIAKWSHLEALLEKNPGYKDISLIPNITEDHVKMSKIKKMKVEYASQVFSQTVGRTLGALAGFGILPIECKETAYLLLLFDNIFDSLNGSFGKSRKYGKPLLGRLTESSLHWKFWNGAKHNLQNMKFINKINGRTEYVPTLKNWIWTIDGIQLLFKKIKYRYNVPSLWLRQLNQDPIEFLFGAIRSHGCRNSNPTPEEFESAFTTLLINSMSSVHTPETNWEKHVCHAKYPYHR